MIKTFTFRWHRECVLDLGEVEDHGQLVYLATVGQVAGRHDRRDTQLLLQNAEGQLVIMNGTGLVQGGHVSVEKGQQQSSTTFAYSYPLFSKD